MKWDGVGWSGWRPWVCSIIHTHFIDDESIHKNYQGFVVTWLDNMAQVQVYYFIMV